MFTEIAFEFGHVSEWERQIILWVYENLKLQPDFIILLYCDLPTVLSRIKKRGRVAERNISVEYVKRILERYDTVMKGDNVLRICTNQPPVSIADSITNFLNKNVKARRFDRPPLIAIEGCMGVNQ